MDPYCLELLKLCAKTMVSGSYGAIDLTRVLMQTEEERMQVRMKLHRFIVIASRGKFGLQEADPIVYERRFPRCLYVALRNRELVQPHELLSSPTEDDRLFAIAPWLSGCLPVAPLKKEKLEQRQTEVRDRLFAARLQEAADKFNGRIVQRTCQLIERRFPEEAKGCLEQPTLERCITACLRAGVDPVRLLK